MRNPIRDLWRARGDRNEELATLRGMLKASEAKNIELAQRMAAMEQHLNDLHEFLMSSVIVRKV